MDLTLQEAKAMAAVIGFLLKQKQPPYQIGINHRELGISEKTLYKHIENAVFHETARITVLDLRRRYSEKFPKTDKRNIKGGATGNTYKVGSTRTIRITYKAVLAEYSCAMKSHFRKSGNQMSGKWKSSYASLLA